LGIVGFFPKKLEKIVFFSKKRLLYGEFYKFQIL
jgi:hypothetical protein